jgi:hypothetical protein
MRLVLEERAAHVSASPPSPPWSAQPPPGLAHHALAALVGAFVAAVTLIAVAVACMHKSYRRLNSPRMSSSSASHATRRRLLPVGSRSGHSDASTTATTGGTTRPSHEVPSVVLSEMIVTAASAQASVTASAPAQPLDARPSRDAVTSPGASPHHGEVSMVRSSSLEAGGPSGEDCPTTMALAGGEGAFDRVEAWQAGIKLQHATKQRMSITVFEGACHRTSAFSPDHNAKLMSGIGCNCN